VSNNFYPKKKKQKMYNTKANQKPSFNNNKSPTKKRSSTPNSGGFENNNNNFQPSTAYSYQSAIPAALASLSQPLPATRFSSTIARDLMEKFPTEHSARAQLLYSQLQVEALTDMNAKLQEENKTLVKNGNNNNNKHQKSTTTSLNVDQEAELYEKEEFSATTLELLDEKIDRVIHHLQQQQQTENNDESTSTKKKFVPSVSSRNLRALLDKVEQQLLPLSEKQLEKSFMRNQIVVGVSQQKERNESVHNEVKIRDLEKQLEISKRREEAAVAKSQELQRQIHYLKQFQIALCSSSTSTTPNISGIIPVDSEQMMMNMLFSKVTASKENNDDDNL
jgi:hypothetical protein